MFAQLPERLKKEVLYYLETNNFKMAKEIHDGWMRLSQESRNKIAASRAFDLKSSVVS
jgi:hypothetical protein